VLPIANSPFQRVKLKLCAIPSQNLLKRLFERPTPSPLKIKRVQRAERATRRDQMFIGKIINNFDQISNILMAKLQYSIQLSLDTEMRICLALC